MQYSIFPFRLLKIIEDGLADVLEDYLAKLRADHSFISFIQDEHRKDVPNLFRFANGLWLGKEKSVVRVLNVRQGLSGKAIEERKVLLYPNDEAVKEAYVASDDGVVAEAVGPVRFLGKVTGIVLFDRLQHGVMPQPFGEEERYLCKDAVLAIEKELAEIERAVDSEQLAHELQGIADECLTFTRDKNTKRGYIALKTPGRLKYYRAGANIENFRNLTWRGLTGKCLQTGAVVYEGDVLSNPIYVNSDEEIHSELVVPVKHEGGETIGIINLESTRRHAYSQEPEAEAGKQGEIDWRVEHELTKKARRIAETQNLRALYLQADFLYASSALLNRVAYLREESRERDLENPKHRGPAKKLDDLIFKALEESVRRGLALVPDQCRFEPSSGTDSDGGGAEPTFSKLAVVEEAGGRHIKSPLFTGDGRRLGTLLVEPRPDRDLYEQIERVEYLVMIASNLLQEHDERHRQDMLRFLMESLVLRPTDDVFSLVVEAVPVVLDSDHCTIFHKVDFRGDSIFLPLVSSSASSPQPSDPHQPWYLASAESGLTGAVLEARRPLILHDVRDQDELDKRRKELGVKILEWKGLLSEDPDQTCRAFIGFPLFQPDGELIGVLRTHRASVHGRSRFSDEQCRALETIAALLGPRLAAMRDRSEALGAARYSGSASRSSRSETGTNV